MLSYSGFGKGPIYSPFVIFPGDTENNLSVFDFQQAGGVVKINFFQDFIR